MTESLTQLHATASSTMPPDADVLVGVPVVDPPNTRDFKVVKGTSFILEALRNLAGGFAGLNGQGRLPLLLLDPGAATAGQILTWSATLGWSPAAAPSTGGTVDLANAVDGVTIDFVGGKLVVIGQDLGSLAAADAYSDTDYILKREGGASGTDHFGPVTGLVDYIIAALAARGIAFAGTLGVAVAPLTDAANITTDGQTNPGNFFTVTAGAIGRNFDLPTRLLPGSYTWFVTMGVANAAPVFGFISKWLGTGGVAPTFSTASGKTDAVTIAWSGTAVIGATFAKGS